jgi:lysophospholipase L1-like esterase
MLAMWRSTAVMLAALATSTGVQADALRYLALGDSYTIGEGEAIDGRWPVQLARQLRAAGIPLADPHIIATTGWTTDELSAAMDAAEPLGEWDFVSLLIGVNNQYRGRSVENFSDEFAALLRRAIALAGDRRGRVVVLAIPDWGVTPFAQGRDRASIAAALDAYNAAKRAVCDAHGVAFVDIAPVTRAHGTEPAMLVEDGLHPSAGLYALWTQAAAEVVRGLLQQPAARAQP